MWNVALSYILLPKKCAVNTHAYFWISQLISFKYWLISPSMNIHNFEGHFSYLKSGHFIKSWYNYQGADFFIAFSCDEYKVSFNKQAHRDFSLKLFFLPFIILCGIDFCGPCKHQIMRTGHLVEVKGIMIPAAKSTAMSISRAGWGPWQLHDLWVIHLLKNQKMISECSLV